MKLSSSVSYAVGILLQVYVHGNERPLTASAIAEGCSFPPRFLYRILRRLVDAGLLTGVSGPGGGYALARRARAINLLDVVEAIDGRLEATRLTPVCPRHREAIKRINAASAEVARRASDELVKVTLDELGETAIPKGKGGKGKGAARKAPGKVAAAKRTAAHVTRGQAKGTKPLVAARDSAQKPGDRAAGKKSAAKKTAAESRSVGKRPTPGKKTTKAARTAAVE